MRITLLCFFLGLAQVMAVETYAQMTKLSMKVNNEPLEKVLKFIEDESEFFFLYNRDLIDVEQKVSVNAENKTIKSILDDVLEETDISYVVYDRQIVLTNTSVINEMVAQQQPAVSGKVTDMAGQPLPGVTVIVKGTTQGTVTNADGNYTISNIPDDAVLQFSFVGMKAQEVAVSGKTSINVTMVEDAVGLEEVVAVGYGTQKRASVTGAVATVGSEKLTVAPVASTTNTLAGRLPGLITKQESGLPGADNASLSIRGFGAPLVIVDGIESSFNNIDANEIESITVLKDAAAAIYGARAGDGVILVTTKRGKADKPTITLNSSTTFQQPSKLVKMASSGQMAELLREQTTNQGLPESQQRFSQEEVDLFYAGTNPDYPNTDWLDYAANDWAPEQQHNLSVRGGSEKIKYYGFLGYLDQKTMWKRNGGGYSRYNLRSNIDAQILDNLKATIDISTIWEDKNHPMREQQTAIWQEYWNTEPYWNPTLPDGRLAYGGAGGAVSLAYMSDIELSGYRRNKSQNIKGSLALDYDFTFVKGLSARAFININQDYNFFKHWAWASPDSWSYNYSNDTYTKQNNQAPPFLTHQDFKSKVLTGQFSLNYNRTFNQVHQVSALALYEAIDYANDWISAGRIDFKSKAIEYLFAGSLVNQTSDGRASEMGRTSYVGRINYGYRSKYLIEATIRADQSAKFNEDNRLGVFPSVSLGWRISEEPFMESLSKLENLKLRASYSQTGKDAVGNFQYLSGYEYFYSSYMMGNTASNGLITTGMPNPLLTWETMTIYNAGLDFSLNKRILFGEFDAFYRLRDGIPGQRLVSLPTTFGANLPVENLNAINTRGFELLLGHEGRWNDLSWSLSGNISWSRSKWEFYDEPEEWTDPDQERQKKRTGQWTDRRFAYLSDGLFTSQEEIDALTFKYNETQGNVAIKPGDISYIDANGDGLLNWKDMVEIGNGTMPHWIGGLNMDVKYKNFDLTAFFQGAWGFTQQIKFKYGNNFSELMYNERWTPENNSKDGLIPRMGGASYNNYDSDFNIKNSSYVRLKTASLGYNIPQSILQKVNIQNLRIYVAGTNLFTFSGLEKYSIDAEAPDGNGQNYYPLMRTISFGLNLSL